MAAQVGYSGQVRVGVNVVADVQEWSGDFEATMLDQTALGDSWERSRPGLKKGSATIQASWNYGDTLGQKALQDAFFAGTAVTLNLDTAASGASRTYSGSAYVAKIKPAVKVDERVTQVFELTFDGAVTFA